MQITSFGESVPKTAQNTCIQQCAGIEGVRKITQSYRIP